MAERLVDSFVDNNGDLIEVYEVDDHAVSIRNHDSGKHLNTQGKNITNKERWRRENNFNREGDRNSSRDGRDNEVDGDRGNRR